MSVKKLLSILTIIAVVSLGIMGALSAIPHTHNKDSDHSKHDSCPICQFSIQGFSATIIDFSSIIFVSLACYRIINVSTLCDRFSYLFISARAPPATI